METAGGSRDGVTGGPAGGISNAARGGGRKTPVAHGASNGDGRRRDARLAWFRRLRESVWAPIAVKALGVLAGMLALAGVGASSLARGVGVPVAVGSGAPGAAIAAGLGVLGKVEPGRTVAARAGSGIGASAGTRVEVDGGADAGAGMDAGAGGVTADGKVILNRAGIDELCTLPGVGPKRAQAILDLRAKLGGRFKRMADLLRLKGIGPKGLRKIEAKAVLDAP